MMNRLRIASATILAIVLALAGVISLLPVPRASAAADATLTLTPSASAVKPGDTFSVNVDLGLPTNTHAVSSVVFQVTFESSLFKVTNAASSSSFPSVMEKVIAADSVAMSLSVGSDTSLAVKQSTTAATISFEAIGEGRSHLRLKQVTVLSIAVGDSFYGSIIGQITNASVCIAPDLDCSAPKLVLSKEKSKFNGVVIATMTDFTPNSTVTLRWPRQFENSPCPVKDELACPIVTDSNGDATASFRTPLEPYGPYTVTATDTASLKAADTLTVIPRINLNPTSGPPCTVVRVYFYGFSPGQVVEVRFYNLAGDKYVVPGKITIAENGRGSKLVTIPCDAEPGRHKIVGKVIGVSRSASMYFTVTPAAAAEVPSPTATPTATASPTAEPSPTETPTLEPTPIPTEPATPEPAPTDSPTAEASPTDSPTAEPPAAEPSPTDTPVPTSSAGA